MAFENDGHAVKALHARLADMVGGYRDGIERTKSHVVAAYFEAHRAQHDQHMGELSRLMLAEGLRPCTDGTWAKLAYRGAMTFDTAVDEIDARVTGAVTRSERMLADLYDYAMWATRGHPEAHTLLARQMAELDGLFDGGAIARATDASGTNLHAADDVRVAA